MPELVLCSEVEPPPGCCAGVIFFMLYHLGFLPKGQSSSVEFFLCSREEQLAYLFLLSWAWFLVGKFHML